MSTFASDLIGLLGKAATEPEVIRATSSHGFDDVLDAPPARTYLSAFQMGVCLLFEANKVIDVQIYVQPEDSYSAYPEPLPFDLRAGMSQQEVHEVLGPPSRFDEFDSHYVMHAKNLKLTVAYDSHGVVRYLSVARPGRFK